MSELLDQRIYHLKDRERFYFLFFVGLNFIEVVRQFDRRPNSPFIILVFGYFLILVLKFEQNFVLGGKDTVIALEGLGLIIPVLDRTGNTEHFGYSCVTCFEDNHFDLDPLRVFGICFPFDVNCKHKRKFSIRSDCCSGIQKAPPYQTTSE